MDKYLLKKNKQPGLNVEPLPETPFSLDAFNNNVPSTPATNTTSKSKLTSNSKESTLANTRSVSPILDVSQKKNKKVLSHASFRRWQKSYSWLLLRNNKEGICSICTEAVKKQFSLPNNQNSQRARKAFVVTGFTLWKNAYLSLPNYERSELHRTSKELLLSSKSVSVVQHMLVANKKTMMENRTALKKIFCTIRVLALQGLPLRGSGSDERSNFNQILQARSEDVSELKAWLDRKGHKWTSHDMQNEILDLMASRIRHQNLKKIKAAHFFALMLDETSDIARLEQVSISIRIVSDNLSIREIFLGFYDIKNTKSQTIYALVKHVFAECGLDMKKLRGQCYDGTSNVSGKISGLQTRIRKEEPRAVFVHCNAHRLNLVVHDAIEDVTTARNFVGVIKDLITFIRDSPKRLAEYKKFQEAVLKEDEEENLEKASTIAPYCPTRWCMRVFSLKTLQQKINYMAALQFLGAIKMNREVDSSISSKAAGFLKHLESFEFYFQLTMIVEVFEKIEILNKKLQESNLCALDSHRKVDAVMISLEAMRDLKFELIWKKSEEGVEEIGFEEPKLKRSRTVSKHIDPNFNTAHAFKTPKEYYSRMYYEVFDCVLMSLKERFETNTLSHLDELETFSIGGDADTKKIIDFYHDDFDEEKLLRDRQMFLDITQRKNVQLRHVKDVVTFFEKNDWCANLVPKYFKFIQLLLTVPGSTCTNERSFSSLRRLKNYLRSTILQDRLNNIAILHVHYDMAKKLNLDELIDEFISKNSKRTATFALIPIFNL